MKNVMTDQQLVKLLRKKNKEAIHKLYTQYSPILLALCMRYFPDREEAKDAMHEGFMRVLNAIDSYKGDGSFEGWIKRIVINNAMDMVKKQNKTRSQPLEISEEPTEEPEEEHEIDLADVNTEKPNIGFVRNASLSSKDMLDEIHKLPDKYRLVFVLFVLEDLSHADIAKKLGIDEKASRTRLNRARNLIRSALYQKSISVLAK